MAIDKRYGNYTLQCDECEETEVELQADDFHEAVQERRQIGWISRKTAEGWKDICPDCQAKRR